MTPTDHARRLVGLTGWEWHDRMSDGGTARLVTGTTPIIWVRVPDLDDDATRGIVLGMLSRRVGGYCWIHPNSCDEWLCWVAGRRLLAEGSSWAEALVNAWEATAPTPAPATPPPPSAAGSS